MCVYICVCVCVCMNVSISHYCCTNKQLVTKIITKIQMCIHTYTTYTHTNIHTHKYYNLTTNKQTTPTIKTATTTITTFYSPSLPKNFYVLHLLTFFFCVYAAQNLLTQFFTGNYKTKLNFSHNSTLDITTRVFSDFLNQSDGTSYYLIFA